MKKLAGCAALTFSLVLAGLGVHAANAQSDEEIRQEEGHVHGVVELNAAVEDSRLFIELESPAVNIVGFEHTPKTAEQESAIDEAILVLEAGDDLFSLPADADCTLANVAVESTIAESHEGEHAEHAEHGDEHAEHGDEHAEHGDEHGEHADEHGDEHSQHEEGEHDHHEGEHAEEVHSEFAASYEFECSNSDALNQIDVGLFDAFPGIEEIEVQALTDSGQIGVELTPANTSLTW